MSSLNTMVLGSKHWTLNPFLFPALKKSSSSFASMISFQRGQRSGFCFLGMYVKGRIFSVNSERIYPISHFQGQWEEPDDGSGSEYDDDDDDDNDGDNEHSDEEIEENDLDFESDWETDNDAKFIVNQDKESSVKKYDEYLATEIEQVLSPEESAILARNGTFQLEKISTAKWNPLHTFALAGQIKFMDRLLENGMHVDQVDKDGLTALHHATIGKREAVISHLLRKGANPQARDLEGATPLHYAVQVGAMQTVKLLIKYNVDVNIADNEGWTPLHVAMQSRNRHIAKVLLINGADMRRKNKDGKTPLDLSMCYGKDFKSYDLAKLLKLVPANNREL